MLHFVTENQKAIVSLDLQLYSKCIQLQGLGENMGYPIWGPTWGRLWGTSIPHKKAHSHLIDQ